VILIFTLFFDSSDWELAFGLQPQEFEQQPLQSQKNFQQANVGGGSRLANGPQVGSKRFL
jgi:hypothetical protein